MKNENPFKEKLYHHTMPVREDVWEVIEKQLPVQEKNKLPLFWIILFASTLLGGYLMFGFNQQKSSGTPQPTEKTTDDVSSAEEPAPQSNTTLSLTENSGEVSTSSISNAASGSDEATGGDKSVLNSNTSDSDYTLHNSSNKTQKHAAKQVSGAILPSAKNQKDSATNAKASANAQVLNVTTPGSTTMSDANALQADKPDVPAQEAIFRTTWMTDLLPLYVNLEEEAAASLDAEMSSIRPDPSCYKFTSSGGRYYFSADLFAGHGYSPRSFADNGSESYVYRQARKSTEANRYAWSAGARFNMHLHNGFAIRLGLLYDQAGDLFDYTDTLATQSTTRIDSFFSADGSFLYSDTNRVLIFGTLIKKIHNTYRHLDVPILLSYEMPIGRSTCMINVGPVFNLSSSNEGQILDPMLHPRTITPGQPNILSAYKTSLGISVYLGLGFVFPLSDKFAGLVEPRYLYRIKPVTVKSYPLQEHRHFTGLNFGIRYFMD